MTCKLCPVNANQFDPACMECGGRYLRAIQAIPLTLPVKQAWLRKALADWMAIGGHSETRLRELAAGSGRKSQS